MAVIFGSPGLFPVYDVYDLLHEKMKECKKPIYPILPSVINVKDEIAYFLAKGRINFPDEVLFGSALAKVYNTPKPQPEAHGLFLVDSSGIFTALLNKDGLNARVVEVDNKCYVITDTATFIVTNDKLRPSKVLDSVFHLPSQKIQEIFQLNSKLLLLVVKEQFDVRYILARKMPSGWMLDEHEGAAENH